MKQNQLINKCPSLNETKSTNIKCDATCQNQALLAT